MTEERFTWDWSMEFERQVVTDHHNSQYEMMEKDCCELLNKLFDENEQLKCNHQKAIGFIYDGICEMIDGKRDYAETLFHKAVELIK